MGPLDGRATRRGSWLGDPEARYSFAGRGAERGRVERGRGEAVGRGAVSDERGTPGEGEGGESRRRVGTQGKAAERSGGATECAPHGIGSLSIPAQPGGFPRETYVCFTKFVSCRFNLEPPPDPGRSGLMAQRRLHTHTPSPTQPHPHTLTHTVAARGGRSACRSKGIAAAMAVVVMLVGRCEGLGKLHATAPGDRTLLQVMPARKPSGSFEAHRPLYHSA